MLKGSGMMHGPGGGGGGGEDKPKRPSGMAHPAVCVSSSESKPTTIIGGPSPMPVVLTSWTILKLASVIFVPLLGILSAGIYHYHKTNTHMDNVAIHLGTAERPTFETKVEANKARAKIETSIKREVKLQAREIKIDVAAEQKAQIKKLSTDIKIEQKVWCDRLLAEVKKARRDINNK